jgi:hypothetical protein
MSSRGAELQGLAIEALESRDADLEARNADLGLRTVSCLRRWLPLTNSWSGWCRGTRATRRCRRHPMICRAGRLPASGNAAGPGNGRGRSPGASVHLHADPRVQYLSALLIPDGYRSR